MEFVAARSQIAFREVRWSSFSPPLTSISSNPTVTLIAAGDLAAAAVRKIQ